MHDDTTKRIAELNDRFRSQFMMPVFFNADLVPGRIVMTAGVSGLSPEAQIEIAARVRDFTDFTPDNNPHKERDFGAFEHAGNRIFWKIDYYDETFTKGSEDPSDLRKTKRVLTIMLASEY